MTTKQDDVLISSKCPTCQHLMCREFKVSDPTEIGVTNEFFIDNVDKDGYIRVTENICLKLNYDIIYAITKCNKYTKIVNNKSLFLGNNSLYN